MQEDFDGLNYGMVEILAQIALSLLATTLDTTTTTMTLNNDPTVIIITAVVVAVIVAILIVSVALMIFILFRRLRYVHTIAKQTTICGHFGVFLVTLFRDSLNVHTFSHNI